MFEAIYAGAEAGGTKPPWDYGAPRPQLVEWAEARNLAGGGHEALVVGCGYGADAEFLAQLGFRTTGFDGAPTAITAARQRYPASGVDYFVADVLDRPREWQGRFDLAGAEGPERGSRVSHRDGGGGWRELFLGSWCGEGLRCRKTRGRSWGGLQGVRTDAFAATTRGC